MAEILNTIRAAAVGFAYAPAWAVSLAMVLAAVAITAAVDRSVFRLLQHLVSDQDVFWRTFVQRSRGPARGALLVVLLGFVAAVAPLSSGQAMLMGQVLLVGTILLIGYVALAALTLATALSTTRYRIDVEDNLLARKHVTQMRILNRAAATLIVMVTIGAALMTFEPVRQYGVSLLASAGAAGLIVGLAMQPILANLVAGVQIAITQPIRLEDAVVVEGEWGWVEEINSTYVVVRLWDWRRMVLPLTYFIQKPFQNWTRQGGAIVGSVFLRVDYTAPVEALRTRLTEIVAESHLWDRQVVNLQVSDAGEHTMELRILVSASTSPKTWDLRCEVREKMLAFLQQSYPQALPRQRTEFSAADTHGRSPGDDGTRPVLRMAS